MPPQLLGDAANERRDPSPRAARRFRRPTNRVLDHLGLLHGTRPRQDNMRSRPEQELRAAFAGRLFHLVWQKRRAFYLDTLPTRASLELADLSMFRRPLIVPHSLHQSQNQFSTK